jgi:hypothetical protein
VPAAIIVGAGGTVAQASSYVHVGTTPPLDVDFFDVARSIGGANPAIQQRLADFNQLLVLADIGMSAPTGGPASGLERIFGDLYYEVSYARVSYVWRAYVALVRLYAAVIGASTDWIVDRPDLGDLDTLIQHERRRIGRDTLTVATFNHDLVLEGVAERMYPDPNGWCLSSLYGHPTHRVRRAGIAIDNAMLIPVFTRHDLPRFAHHHAACHDLAPFQLLKLHGSLNWLTRMRQDALASGSLFPRRDKPVLLAETKHIPPEVGWTRQPGLMGRVNYPLFPLLIPPIFEKGRLFNQDIVRWTWARANDYLEYVDRLVVIGCALPPADHHARQLISRSCARSKTLREVVCINPSATAVAELQKLVDPHPMANFVTVTEYLANRTSERTGLRPWLP